jgi:uncharacterized integral membrane protein
MQIRNLALLIVLGAALLFAALNWSAFMAPTTLSLGIAQVQAPLGLIMLALLAVLTAVFLTYLVYLQTTVLLETRRHARELHAQRELADKAEASRFTELRNTMEARLTQLENSLAAHIGELAERLDRDRPAR